MSARKPFKSFILRWTTLKGLAAILLFLLLAILLEYIVVLYGMRLGVKDEKLLAWNLRFPGTDWNVTVAASSLFHLVPIAAVISLLSSWMYLARQVGVKPAERWKGKAKPASRLGEKKAGEHGKKLMSKVGKLLERAKSGLLKIRSIAYIWERVGFAGATIRSALTVLLVFGALVISVSLLTYPQLIPGTVLGAYQNNHPLLGFARSVSNLGRSISETLPPVGWISSAMNNMLLSLAPGLRNLVFGLGGLTRPLVQLDDVGKYLILQNIASWVSSITAIIYGTIRRKSYRLRRGRKA